MKNSMVKMIKKVTATILAAATVMGATIAVAPTMVRAEDFNGIKLEELSEHPTSNMDINVIKNAYKVGKKIDENAKSGDVVYINSNSVGCVDMIGSMSTPHGKDIVVVYRTYTTSNLFGQKVYKVNCKSLIDGETFDLTLSDYDAQLFELNKVQNLNDGGVDVDDAGLQNTFQWVGSKFAWVKSLWPF